MRNTVPILLAAAMIAVGCGDTNGQARSGSKSSSSSTSAKDATANPYYSTTAKGSLNVPTNEWKKLLTEDLFHVAFEKGTERPFTGKFTDAPHTGTYRCAVCGNALFAAQTKFDSGTGWPSFYQPMDDHSLTDKVDRSLGMERSEVICGRCGAHLGHVFDDGPRPTGLRYCINAVSLDLTED